MIAERTPAESRLVASAILLFGVGASLASAVYLSGYDRVLQRFGRPDRGIAIYDVFGSVLGATPEVRASLGPISPMVTASKPRLANSARAASRMRSP